MKLILKIKLLPTEEQASSLLETMEEANTVCNAISEVAWEKRIFNNFKLHHEVYHPFKIEYKLTSQMLIRCIAKVADSYKIDKKTRRSFKSLGSISYDSRILSYKSDSVVSLWTVDGRQKINFICHNTGYFPYIKGEADLVYKKGKFYLFQTVEVPEEDVHDVEEFIGVDFGLTNIVTTSDGINYSAEWLNAYREKRQGVRSSLQSKGTRGSKKLLKRLSGREKTTATIVNHTISKAIVASAKERGKGIALEDLTGIRFTSKRRNRKFRVKLGKWAFFQLRTFIEYKSLRNGVPVMVIDPRYTSQMCHSCKHIGKRTNKVFKCTNDNCKVIKLDADENASRVISLLGAAINQPEKSTMFCSLHSVSDLKPCRSLVGG